MREQRGCAPFAEAGPVVEAVRRRILDHARIATTNDPALGIRYENGAAIIESRTCFPGELTADPRDRRRLGVKIAELEIAGEQIPLDHPAFTEGWHDTEADGRWTNGRAVIPKNLLVNSDLVTISLAATLPYPRDDRAKPLRVDYPPMGPAKAQSADKARDSEDFRSFRLKMIVRRNGLMWLYVSADRKAGLARARIEDRASHGIRMST
jgi:hypothetical protein